MTYPPPLHDGRSAEATVWIRPTTAPPDLVYETGTRVDYLATGRSTGGLFGLYRWRMGPDPSGPGPHFHRTMSESFFILAGSIRIFDGNRWVDTEPGDFVHVPPGGIHGFRNESGAPASMLLHFAPGAPREAYFEGLASLGEMSVGEREAFMERHDNIWVDP